MPRCLLNIKKNLYTCKLGTEILSQDFPVMYCIWKGLIAANRRTSKRTIYPCRRKSSVITGNEPQGIIVMSIIPGVSIGTSETHRTDHTALII